MNLEAAVSMVVSGLEAKADAENALAMQRYMKTDMPFRGVMSKGQVEVFKALKGSFAPSTIEEYEALVLHLWSLPHREEKYIGLSVAEGFRLFITPDSLPMYAGLIREGAWWDFVDRVAVHCVGVALRAHRLEVEPVVREWIDDECMWIRRSAILCQIGHKADTDEQMLFDFCSRRAFEKEFFIRKAIGWALRDYSYTAPESVALFLVGNRNTLSGLSFREGAKALVRKGWTPSG